eukprot:UN00760
MTLYHFIIMVLLVFLILEFQIKKLDFPNSRKLSPETQKFMTFSKAILSQHFTSGTPPSRVFFIFRRGVPLVKCCDWESEKI